MAAILLGACASPRAPIDYPFEILVPSGTHVAEPLKLPRFRHTVSSGQARQWAEYSNIGIQSLFARRVVRFVVIRHTNDMGPASSEARLGTLTYLDTGGSPATHLAWAEFTEWTVEARVEFRDGPPALVYTDGIHICVIDQAGQPWFYRLHAVRGRTGPSTSATAGRPPCRVP